MSIASELQNYADGLDDAWDAAEDMGATIPTDRNMVNLDDAIRTIPVSSPNDGVLTITQNGTTIQTFSADQATNVTAALTDTTYSDFTGATSSVAGANGLVPAPSAGDEDKVLKGDGTWQSLSCTETAFYGIVGLVPGDYPNGLIRKNGQRVGGVEVYQDFWAGKRVLFDNKFVVVAANDFDEGSKFFTLVDITNYDWQNHKIDGVIYYAEVSDSASGTDHLSATTTQEKLTAGTNIAINGATISATDTTYSDFTGATSSVAGAAGLVPAPAAGDEAKALHGDGTWKDTTAKLVEMSYGESNAWTKFINAYNAGSIVYCRASSNSNPGSGSQTRKAFMAYVNNAASPTNVEFQYVRSQSSKTDSQQTDQVFVYTLTNASGGTWSVATRNMGPKINVSGPITKTFTSGANATITLGANAMTGATSSADGAAGIVPKPVAGDQDKVLTGAGTWAKIEAGAGISITYNNGTYTISLA